MKAYFINNFSFTEDNERIESSLKYFKRVLFLADKLSEGSFNHIYESGFHEFVACRKIELETNEYDLEDLRHLKFKEYEGD